MLKHNEITVSSLLRNNHNHTNLNVKCRHDLKWFEAWFESWFDQFLRTLYAHLVYPQRPDISRIPYKSPKPCIL